MHNRQNSTPGVLLAIALLGALCQPGRAIAQESAAASLDDWTRLVPGDVRLYVELRNLTGMRQRFARLGIWQTVRDLAEGRTAPTDPASGSLSESLLSLSADEAVSAVLGRRSALLATDSGTWQRGVILADLGTRQEADRLLARLGAVRERGTGPVLRFTTKGGILIAQREALIVLGPAGDPEGLWERTVSLAAGKLAPSLHGRSEFASLRGRLTQEHDGLVFATWPDEHPYAFAGCHRLIAGFKISDEGLNAEVHGIRRESSVAFADVHPLDVGFLRSLPSSPLLVWSGPLDGGALSPSVATEPGERKSLLDMLASVFTAAAGGSRAAASAFGPRGVVLIDAPRRASRTAAFSLPSISLICDARDLDALSASMDAAFRLLGRILGNRAAGQTAPSPSLLSRKTVDKLEMQVLALGRLLARRLQLDILSDIELCWAASDGRLWISTSAEQMARAHRAMHRQRNTLERDPVLAAILPEDRPDAPLVEWALLRGRQTSLYIGRALHYIGRTNVDALRDTWWRDWARDRLRQRARFGVAMRDAAAVAGGAEVLEVEFDSPAAGLLQPGDIVTAFEGQSLNPASPARDLADRYARRGDVARVTLTVRNGEHTRQVEIPVPRETSIDVSDLAPIRALHLLRVLLQRVELASLERRGLDPARLDVEIRVKWHGPAAAP